MKKSIIIFLFLLTVSLFAQTESFDSVSTKAESTRDESNYIKEHFLFDMRNLGKAKVEATYEYGGYYAKDKRASLESVSYDKLNHHYREQLNRFVGGSEKNRWGIQNLSMLEKPLIEKISGEAVSQAVTQKDVAQLLFFEHELFSFLPSDFIWVEERSTPLEENYRFPTPTVVELSVKVLTPRGFVFEEKPRIRTIEMGILSVDKNLEMNEDGFTLFYRYHFGYEEVTPEDAVWTSHNLLRFARERKPLLIRLVHHVGSLVKDSRFTEALALYQKEIQDPEVKDLDFLRLASFYLDLGMGKAAKETMDLAVKQFPFSVHCWFMRGLVYFQKELGQMLVREEDHLVAKDSFEKVLFLDPYDFTMRKTILELFLFDEQGVFGRNPRYLKRAGEILTGMLSSDVFYKNYEDYCLYLSYLLPNKELSKKTLSYLKPNPDSVNDHHFFLSAFSAHREGGLSALLEFVKENQEGKSLELLLPQLRSLAFLFFQFGEPAAGLTLFNYSFRQPVENEEEEQKRLEMVEKLIAPWEAYVNRVFYVPLAEIEKRNDEAGATDWVLRFFFELFKADGFSFENLEPFVSAPLFQRMKGDNPRLSFNMLFKNLVLVSNLENGSFFFQLLNYLNAIALQKAERLSEDLYLVQGAREGEKGLKFLVRWNHQHFEIEAIEDFYPALGERIYRNLALNPSLVEGYLKYLDRVAYDQEEKKEMNFSGLDYSPYLVYHKEFRKQLESGECELSLREMIQGFVVESDFETAELKQLVLEDLEKLSLSGKDFKNRWAALLLCFYYAEQNEAARFKSAAQRLFSLAKDLPVAYYYQTMALLLDNDEKVVEEFTLNLQNKTELIPSFTDNELRVILYQEFSYFLNYDRMIKVLPSWEETLGKQNLASFYNLIAWSSLFRENQISPKDFYYVRKGLELSNNNDPAIIHTAATMYACTGQNDEALKLLKSLDEDKSSYSPSDWYLYGLLMKNLGYEELAKKAFDHCLQFEKPSLWGYPSSCSFLLHKTGYR